jgi:hypothetical protein
MSEERRINKAKGICGNLTRVVVIENVHLVKIFFAAKLLTRKNSIAVSFAVF